MAYDTAYPAEAKVAEAPIDMLAADNLNELAQASKEAAETAKQFLIARERWLQAKERLAHWQAISLKGMEERGL